LEVVFVEDVRVVFKEPHLLAFPHGEIALYFDNFWDFLLTIIIEPVKDLLDFLDNLRVGLGWHLIRRHAHYNSHRLQVAGLRLAHTLQYMVIPRRVKPSI